MESCIVIVNNIAHYIKCLVHRLCLIITYNQGITVTTIAASLPSVHLLHHFHFHLHPHHCITDLKNVYIYLQAKWSPPLSMSTICNATHFIFYLPHCHCSLSTFIVLIIYDRSISSYVPYILTIVYIQLSLYAACCSAPCSRASTLCPAACLPSSSLCAGVGPLVDFVVSAPVRGRSLRPYPLRLCVAASPLSPASYYRKIRMFTSNGESKQHSHQIGTR